MNTVGKIATHIKDMPLYFFFEKAFLRNSHGYIRAHSRKYIMNFKNTHSVPQYPTSSVPLVLPNSVTSAFM